MLSENIGGRALGGFRGDSFGPFKFAGGALGHGRVDSTRAGGSTLPPPLDFTPPQQAVTLGTLRPRHQRPGSHRAHTHTQAASKLACTDPQTLKSNEHVHTRAETNACPKITAHPYFKYTHTHIPTDQTCTHFNHAHPPPGSVIVLKI